VLGRNCRLTGRLLIPVQIKLVIELDWRKALASLRLTGKGHAYCPGPNAFAHFCFVRPERWGMSCPARPSGAGKSLLLRAIADLDPNEGTVKLDGMLREAVPAPHWRSQVTYVAAEPGWWGDTVQEHFTAWHQAMRRWSNG